MSFFPHWVITYDNFYNILKTWVLIFPDINMLRRKLQPNCCSLVNKTSLLSGLFCRICYLSVMSNRFLMLRCRNTFIFPIWDSVCCFNHRVHVLLQVHKMLPHISLYFASFPVFCSIFLKLRLQVYWVFLLCLLCISVSFTFFVSVSFCAVYALIPHSYYILFRITLLTF